MPSQSLGVIYCARSLQILGVINPDHDWELDDPNLDRWNGDAPTRLLKVPRGSYEQLSFDQVYELVKAVEAEIGALAP